MDAVDELLRAAHERIRALQRFPESTYRLQLHAGFTFRDASSAVPYLHELGVTHCYASPYFKARSGSTHGYDIIDHRALNPEIGTIEDYDAWVDELHSHGMGQILDIVPNHMGIGGSDNVWWNDILENGPASPFAGYFDIAWEDSSRPERHNRVLLPVLGEPYGKALESQQIQLVYDAGTFTIRYFDRHFPLAPRSYSMVLGHRLDDLSRLLDAESAHLNEYKSIMTAISHLPSINETVPEKRDEHQREKEIIKRRLAALAQDCPEISESIHRTIVVFNGTLGEPHSFDLLEQLLDQQAYRLCYWRVAADELNYRRFFDINDLAALSMERLEVFTAAHDLVFRLLRQGKVNGLRIDHPDGLYDPKQYLERLQQFFVLACAREAFESDPRLEGRDWKELEGPLSEHIAENAGGLDSLYVIVEKILDANEEIPANWKTHGTSGYDFINAVNGLFVDASAADAFSRLYQEWIGDHTTFPEMVHQKKYLILRDALSSELHMLGRQLDRLAQQNRWWRDFSQNSLRFALREVIAVFPVYRSYISEDDILERDQRHVGVAVARAVRRNPTVNRSLFLFVRDMLLLRYPTAATEEFRNEQRRFVGKFQQVTSPVMAKGLEDTAFYVYNRLLSLNEVGGDPSRFGTLPETLHRFNQERQRRWPHALSPLATHDTKRGEDMRARLNVLSEIPGEWRVRIEHWQHLNVNFRSVVDDRPAPDANEEYFIYQTLIGAWPIEPCDAAEFAEFIQRIQVYLDKAFHEAKVHSSWVDPNEAYDLAVRNFIANILDAERSALFLQDLREFQEQIRHFGMLNSLAQTLLRMASPGVPDTYQGTELWDFSLVDPDNRRPVDYARRFEMLQTLDRRVAEAGADRRALAGELIRAKEDGRVKLYLVSQALRIRRDRAGLFSTGEYLPLEITGDLKDHAFGFARRQGEDVAIAIVPRLISRLTPGQDDLPLGQATWGKTTVCLPTEIAGRRWRNALTGVELEESKSDGQPAFRLCDVFADLPVALLMATGPNK
jgi:(1->4)-alpha-D-glucan 1-alpha-D-glucosylmutase